MISLTVLGAHQTLLRITPDKGTIKEILFSYETPVAAWTSLQGTMRTATIYSPHHRKTYQDLVTPSQCHERADRPPGHHQ